jgi:hypothetical protein
MFTQLGATQKRYGNIRELLQGEAHGGALGRTFVYKKARTLLTKRELNLVTRKRPLATGINKEGSGAGAGGAEVSKRSLDLLGFFGLCCSLRHFPTAGNTHFPLDSDYVPHQRKGCRSC